MRLRLTMGDQDPITASEDYKRFRSSIPQRKVELRALTTCSLTINIIIVLQIVVDKTNQPWVVYDAGPRHVHSPLVCLPPVCGTADVFFKQLLALSQAGYRVISVIFMHSTAFAFWLLCYTCPMPELIVMLV